MKLAFSTVACPEWTLPRVIEFASASGYEGLELRTFGHADHRLACDPCHTGSDKLVDMLDDAGVSPVSLATSIAYDKAVWPPVVGRVFGDFQKPVRETKQMLEVASAAGAEFVRVFGFELGRGEAMNRGLRRIVERLDLAVAAARHTGTRLLIESGGSFATGEHLARLLSEATTRTGFGPAIAGGYNVAAAHAAGETPADGLAALGSRAAVIKLSDVNASGIPCRMGEGQVPVEDAVKRALAAKFDGWFVVEYPRLWAPELPEASDYLRHAAETCYRWWGEALGNRANAPAA